MIDSLMETIDQFLRSTFGPALKALHAPIDQWLGSLPMAIAVACALGLYLIAVVWVWMLPKEFVFRDAPGLSRWYDLRIWATLVVLPYVLVYIFLGR